MSVEHDGLSFPLNSHGCILSLSMFGFFLDEVDHLSRKEKFLKSPRIWKKSKNILTLPLASDEEAIGTADEMCFDNIIKQVHFFIE